VSTARSRRLTITIVGAGVYGLATAWALARAGHAVTVFEQGDIPNSFGSSVDQHRVIRAPYGSSEAYARLVPDALRAWDVLWRDLGRRLYVETGILVLSDAASAWARESAAVLERLGRKVDWLDAAAVERRFPLVKPEGIDLAFHLPEGGALLAERIMTALARYLPTRGVTLRPATRVVAIEPERARVRLADGDSIEADHLVVAAGAWVGDLLPAMAKRVKPSRQAVIYMEPPAALADAWSRAPVLIEITGSGGFYLVPPVAGTGLKIGDHAFTGEGDPAADRVPRNGEGEEALLYCGRRLRDFDRFRVVEKRICFYTVAPEERFIVEPMTERGLVVSACTGHGFKFAALIGLKIAAALGDSATTARLGREAAGHLD